MQITRKLRGGRPGVCSYWIPSTHSDIIAPSSYLAPTTFPRSPMMKPHLQPARRQSTFRQIVNVALVGWESRCRALACHNLSWDRTFLHLLRQTSGRLSHLRSAQLPAIVFLAQRTIRTSATTYIMYPCSIASTYGRIPLLGGSYHSSSGAGLC